MLVTTIHGDMDDSLLDRKDGEVNNDNEYTTWTEYRLKGQDEIVHRSVHVRLKKPVTFDTKAGNLS
jgi:hypothetical protein